MIEFMAISDDGPVMRLEYDDTCYESSSHNAAVRRMILRAFDAIVSSAGHSSRDDGQQPFTEIRKGMIRAWLREETSAFASRGSYQSEEDVRPIDDNDNLFQRPLLSLNTSSGQKKVSIADIHTKCTSTTDYLRQMSASDNMCRRCQTPLFECPCVVVPLR